MSIRTYFKNIADAIKNVYGTTDTLTPAEMPQAITNFNSIFQTKNLSTPISGQTTVEGCLSSLYSDLSELMVIKTQNYSGTFNANGLSSQTAPTTPNGYTPIFAILKNVAGGKEALGCSYNNGSGVDILGIANKTFQCTIGFGYIKTNYLN